MESKVSTRNIMITYGLYLGVIGLVLHLALWATGNVIEFGWVANLLSFILTVVFIVIGIKTYKKGTDGFISWGQGVKIGMGIAMISGIISVIYTLLFMNVIDPEFQNYAMELQKQQWAEAGMSQDQIEGAEDMAKMFQGPGIISGMILVMSAFFGFIISAIVAAIMKKSDPASY